MADQRPDFFIRAPRTDEGNGHQSCKQATRKESASEHETSKVFHRRTKQMRKICFHASLMEWFEPCRFP